MKKLGKRSNGAKKKRKDENWSQTLKSVPTSWAPTELISAFMVPRMASRSKSAITAQRFFAFEREKKTQGK